MTDIEKLCELMHSAYEEAATKAGWQTQARSRVPWADVPEANKITMRAAVTAIEPLIHADALREAAAYYDKYGPFEWKYSISPWLRMRADIQEANNG